MMMTDPKLHAFVLTFEGAGEARRHSASNEMIRLDPGLNWQFISGYAAGDAELSGLFDPTFNMKYSKRPLAATEIAAYGGHRKMMRSFLVTQLPFGLFLEDDFAAAGSAASWLHLINHIDDVMGHCDMLKLLDFGPPRSGFMEERIHCPLTIVKPWNVGAGAVGYILSRQGAEKILSRKQIFRQIDEDIKYFWELDLDIWTVKTPMVVEISRDLGGSFLERERMEIKRKNRNLKTSLKGNLLAIRRWILSRYHRLKQFGVRPGNDRTSK